MVRRRGGGAAGGQLAGEAYEAKQEVEAARREAEAVKEAAAAEVNLIRHQLATAQAATQEAERVRALASPFPSPTLSAPPFVDLALAR